MQPPVEEYIVTVFIIQGIHVAHVVIDGAIDTPWVRENFTEMVARAPQNGGVLCVDGIRLTTDVAIFNMPPVRPGLLSPAGIAENYWMLHTQSRDAWTHEMDLRPWSEKW